MITGLHDHAQQANNEGAYIPMEEVDAALRRIDRAIACNTERQGGHALLQSRALWAIIREERERMGLQEVKA